MPSNLTLFDDLGTMWNGATPRLRNSFGSPATNEEFSTYVVKNMGFVAVHLYGRSCEVRYRPRMLTGPALRALKDWMKGQTFERIVTAQYDTDWVYGLYADVAGALAKIDSAVNKNQNPRPSDRLARPISKDDLPRTTPLHRALHSLIENWPTLSQSVHRDGLSRIVHQSLQGRYHLIDAGTGGRDLLFREIGSGFVSYTDEWMSRAIGQSIEEQEDSAYGRWVGSVYREALKSGKPMICDCDVITSTRKLGRARLRYKRVLLPARGTANGTWLLNSSIIDPSIDLRAELLGKTA